MSKYTTELRYICEAAAGLTESKGYNSIDEIIAASWDKIFDFSFPIWDPAYKEALCSKIIRHYYTREICAETVARWKLFVRSKMELEMDRFNELYKTTVLQINPLYDVDLTRTHTTTNRGTQETNGISEIETRSSGSTTGSQTGSTTGSRTGETSGTSETSVTSSGQSSGETSGTSSNESTSTSTAGSTSKYSDTPQGAITGLETDTYLTNATMGSNTASNTTSGEGTTGSTSSAEESSTSSTTGETSGTSSETTTGTSSETTTGTSSETTTGSSTSSGTETGTSSNTINIHNLEDYIEHVTGKQGSTLYGTMIRDFRETIICIDEMVIDMLADCFMSIY